MSGSWINNFSPVLPTMDQSYDNSTNIDDLFKYNTSEEDKHSLRMLELKGELLSLMNGSDEFDLLEDEKKSIEDESKDPSLITEINEINTKIQNYLEKFTTIQKELNQCNEDYQKEVHNLRKNISTADTMIEFIQKLPEEHKEKENIKIIIDQMNILSKNILDNEKIKEIRKKYIVKRKNAERLITFIKKINNLNQTSICPLCFTNSVDHFVDPCGHTFCKECIQNHLKQSSEGDLYEVGRNDNSQCCFCRERINIVRPLYFL
jgi:hypothetical protein